MPWFFINLDPTIGGPGQVNSSKRQKGSSNGRPASPQQPTRYRNVQIFQAVDIDVSCPPVDTAMKNSAPDIIISPKHQQFLSRERFPGFPPIHPPWTIEIPQGIHQFLWPFGPAAKVCYHDPSQAQGTKPWYNESISHFAPSCCCDASNMETYKHDAYSTYHASPRVFQNLSEKIKEIFSLMFLELVRHSESKSQLGFPGSSHQTYTS